MLKKRNVKSAELVNKLDKNFDGPVVDLSSELTDFAPFVMDGVVSLAGDSVKIPVKMLRDTAASQFFLLEGVLPLGDDYAVGSDVPMLGLSMKNIVSGEVVVGVQPIFPIKGV